MSTHKISCCTGDTKELEKTIYFLKIINESNRLKILCILKKESLCVCDILKLLDIPQNLASHHLKMLKEFGLIDSKKEGRKIFYSSSKKELLQHTSNLNNFLISNL